MRRTLLPLLALLALVAAPHATAAPAALPTPGFASANVEWLGNVPLHADSAGARLLDGYFYVTSSSQLSIYDARVPESPTLLSTMPLPQQPYFAEEDVDTNGRILLVSAYGALQVVDVRDKAEPTVLATLEGTDEHTISCLLDCTWAYGSEGAVIDLRDPAKPRVAGDWSKAVPGGGGAKHDVTEVAPGMVVTSTGTMALLDARTDPARPKLVSTTKTADDRFLHANLWPREMKDRFLLVGGETSLEDCSSRTAGAFMTFDTRGATKGAPFTLKDEWRPAVTDPTRGDGLYETYCSHWFEPRPGWKDGGELAVGWYEHGTRFLSVDKAGQIEEIGFFSPVATSSSAAYWARKDVVYVMDYQRGLDVLKIHDGKAPATRRGATGLRPDAAPAKANRLLPGMLRGEDWRC